MKNAHIRQGLNRTVSLSLLSIILALLHSVQQVWVSGLVSHAAEESVHAAAEEIRSHPGYEDRGEVKISQ